MHGTVADMVARSDVSTSLRKGILEFCVLALVEHDDRYSTEIVTTLAESGNLTASEGTIYPLLARLRRSGLVESTWAESASGPPRRYYRISKTGVAALENFRNDWIAFRQAVDRIIGAENR